MASRHTFEGHITFSTGAAILFHGHYWEGPVWLPRSQITLIEDHDSHVVMASDWICRVKGLEEFTYYDEQEIERINES